MYEPFEFDLCGPRLPIERRWSEIARLYRVNVVLPLRDSCNHTTSHDRSKLEEEEEEEVDAVEKHKVPRLDGFDGGDTIKSEDDEAETKKKPNSVGLSHLLPRGACGISPDTYIERFLEESRCALFI